MGCSPFMEDVAEALAVAVRVKRPAVQVRSLRAICGESNNSEDDAACDPA